MDQWAYICVQWSYTDMHAQCLQGNILLHYQYQIIQTVGNFFFFKLFFNL